MASIEKIQQPLENPNTKDELKTLPTGENPGNTEETKEDIWSLLAPNTLMRYARRSMEHSGLPYPVIIIIILFIWCGLIIYRLVNRFIFNNNPRLDKEPKIKSDNASVATSTTTIVEPSELLKECPKCGTNLPLNELFCAECGEKLMLGKASRQDIPHSEKTPEKEPAAEPANTPVTALANTIDKPSEALKECPKCGTNLPLNALFCAECGEKLMSGEASRQDIPHSEETPEKEPASEPANAPVTALTNTIDILSETLKECPKCGTNLPLNALFCAKCGERLEPLEVPELDMHKSKEGQEKGAVSQSDNAPVIASANIIDESSDKLKICPKCGMNLPPYSVFCAKCGERLDSQEAPEQEISQLEEEKEKEPISKYDNVSDATSVNASDEPSKSRKECPKYGTDLPLDAMFCAKCGMHFLTEQFLEENNNSYEDITETNHLVNKQAKMANSELTEMPTIAIENKAFNTCEENSSSDKLEPQNKQSENCDVRQTYMFPKNKHRAFYIVSCVLFLIVTICGMTYWFYYRPYLNVNSNTDTANILETKRPQNKDNNQADQRNANEGDNVLIEPIRKTDPVIAHENKMDIAIVSQPKEEANEQKAETNGGDNEIIEPQKQAEEVIAHDDKTEIAVVSQHKEDSKEQKAETNGGDNKTIEPLQMEDETVAHEGKTEIVVATQPKEDAKEQKAETKEDDNEIIEPLQMEDETVVHDGKTEIVVTTQPKEDEKEQKAETNGGDNEIIEPQKQAEEVIAHDDKTEIAVVSQHKEDSKEQKAETNGGDNKTIEPLQMEDETVAHEGKTEIVVATQPKEDAKEQKAETKEDDNEIIEPLQMEDETVAHDGKTEIVVTTQQKEDKREQKAETKEANIEIIEPSQQANEVIAHDDRRKIAIPEQILQEIVGQKVKTSEDDDVSIKPSKQAKITIVQDEKNKHVSLEQLKEDIQDKIEDKEVSTYNQELPKQEDITIPQDNGTEVTTIQIQQIPNIIPINTENGTENEAVSKFQHNENETNKIGKDEQSIDELQKEKTIQQLSYIDSLIKKAENGDVNASFELGLLYESGKGTKKNFEQAFKWYSVVAKRGMSNAQVKVGDMYLNGIGVEKNQKNAVEWYRRAANKDNAQGLYSLGLCYEKGLGLSINYNEAIKLYNEAILLGSLDAQYQLAQCYFKGHGVRKDNHNALDKLKKAASKGHVKSQLAIGKCYSEGKGVVQDAKTAVIWYRKAAEKGDAEGQMQLALCYEKGKGVKQNSVIAVEWAEKAAVQGFTAAEYFLGNAYQNGRGVPQDSDIATLWYRKAANKGGHNVANALQMLEQ